MFVGLDRKNNNIRVGDIITSDGDDCGCIILKDDNIYVDFVDNLVSIEDVKLEQCQVINKIPQKCKCCDEYVKNWNCTTCNDKQYLFGVDLATGKDYTITTRYCDNCELESTCHKTLCVFEKDI